MNAVSRKEAEKHKNSRSATVKTNIEKHPLNLKRRADTEEVTGSNPVSPTTEKQQVGCGKAPDLLLFPKGSKKGNLHTNLHIVQSYAHSSKALRTANRDYLPVEYAAETTHMYVVLQIQ